MKKEQHRSLEKYSSISILIQCLCYFVAVMKSKRFQESWAFRRHDLPNDYGRLAAFRHHLRGIRHGFLPR